MPGRGSTSGRAAARRHVAFTRRLACRQQEFLLTRGCSRTATSLFRNQVWKQPTRWRFPPPSVEGRLRQFETESEDRSLAACVPQTLRVRFAQTTALSPAVMLVRSSACRKPTFDARVRACIYRLPHRETMPRRSPMRLPVEAGRAVHRRRLYRGADCR
jgi:hypothetical protein